MGVAGDNEKYFHNIVVSKFGDSLFKGGYRYLKKTDEFGSVEVSVDERIVHPDGRELLIEIDSGNMAKLIVGQYVLLNCLREEDTGKSMFLVVHYYKKYNARRTINNLRAIERLYPEKKWLPYNAICIEEMRKLIKETIAFEDLIEKLWDNQSVRET